MRIAVDARELCHRPTGVGRYLAELLAEWAHDERARRHDWTLFAHAPPRLGPDWSGRVRVLGGSGGTWWEQWTFARALAADPPDVLFAPAYTAPLTTEVPTVLTVHDVSFFAHPEWFSVREGTRRRAITGRSARRARAIVTDSEFSAREIAARIGLPSERVCVIPLGVRRPAGAYPLVRDPLVLFVGSIFERRRVDLLMKAFDAVVDRVPAAHLEIVGENRTARPRMDLEGVRASARYPDRMAVRSYLDEHALADLYARASAFAFLSEYEGFGLTPLEALAAGVPPVVLDTPVAREVYGPAARYVAASAGQEALVEALVECLTSDRARHEILRHGPEVLARYRWASAARATLAVIEEAARG
jgi:glycosyltransferase involved in cell wall biosynthesis